MLLEPQRVAEIVGGSLHRGGSDRPAERVAIDSRTTVAGDLFVALAGRNHDGHRFVTEAAGRGAVGILAKRAVGRGEAWWVEVDDTLAALQALARDRRSGLRGKLAAITGSNGKTTTKELLATCLRPPGREGSVIASPASFNNHVGLPLTLLALDPSTEYAILEVGSSAPGEIRSLAELCRPDLALITTVAESHLAGLGSVDGVAREKGALVEALPASGVAVLNRDAPFHDYFRSLHSGSTVTFGHDRGSDFRILGVDASVQGLVVMLEERGGKRQSYGVPLLGSHNAANIAAAVAAARTLGVTPEDLRDRLQGFRPPPMRMEAIRFGRMLVVNDAYNANPGSARAALASFRDLVPRDARRVAILGDMLELGDRSADLHREIGAFAATTGLAGFVGVGVGMRGAVEAARAEGVGEEARWFESVEAMMTELGSILRPDDVVLLKASRGVALERCVPGIRRIGEETAEVELRETDGFRDGNVQGR